MRSPTSLSGNSFVNILTGGAGGDVLNGGGGGDTMRGGLDNDFYVVDSTLDTVDEATLGGGVVDTVQSVGRLQPRQFGDVCLASSKT